MKGHVSNARNPTLTAAPRSRMRVRIGFIALVDCAPLLVAHELGLFVKQGVDVELSREVGWATVREKILYRQLDAAHAIAGLTLALRLGLDGIGCPAIAPFVFNLNGNAITLSTDLWRRGVRDVKGLQKLIRSTPQHLFTFGIVARTSSHNFMLRRWLKGAGIDPDHDVRLVVLPPTQMAGSLSAGLIDGYCAGEPWNSVAVANGIGWCPVTSEDLMPGHPEKVLLTTEDFAMDHPFEMTAIIRALHEACSFCDRMENRPQVVEVLHSSGLFHVNKNILRQSLVGPFDDGTSERRSTENFHIFHRNNTNEPTREKADWLLTEFSNNGLIPSTMQSAAHDAAAQCWRSDLFHKAIDTKTAPQPRRKTKPTPQPALV